MKPQRRRALEPGPLTRQLDLFVDELPSPSAAPRTPTPAATPPFTDSESPSAWRPGAPAGMPSPSTRLDADGRRCIELGAQAVHYHFTRSKRRSIGFTIDDDGLRVTAPRWVALAEIDAAIRDRQRWILAKLAERRARSARRLQPRMQWRDGATLPYLGVDLTLRVATTQAEAWRYDAERRELTIGLPPAAGEQQLKDRVQGWLQSQARQLFAERLPLYAAKLAVSYQSFALSSATTQWGSCTAAGRIRLNWRLVHFALPLIDYVIAHELAHLREMNHSPRFWATVQAAFPEFEAARHALRQTAPEMLPIV